MYKQELRLAVVIYGGASLAVYMHGVTKELHKLIRASKAFHELGREQALGGKFADLFDQRESDTEPVYFELIKRLNQHCHLRVVIDVIAGASAGAINGVMLGKAIADDGLLDSQTPMWLQDADIESLGNPHRSRWQKWYLHPLLRALTMWLPKDIGADPETREKIARLIRSAWFQPPLSGERLSERFFEALQSLIRSRRPQSTLLPPGQRLDVYASITDLNGYPSSTRLHEELIADDREHGAFCRLTCRAHPDAAADSDFHDDNLPALVWAARASSSYAGAFPPFHHRELLDLIRRLGIPWPREKKFLNENLFTRDGRLAAQVFDPANRFFVDGGIVNNKPFSAAIQALGQRPADRRVNRHIVYIEPDPHVAETGEGGRPLSYLGTLQAALSTIPRNQPIVEQLAEIVEQDKRVQANRRIVEAYEPRVMAMVGALEHRYARQELSTDLIAYLRLGVAEQVDEEMGLAFEAYEQRRIWRLTEALMEEWVVLAEQPHLQSTRSAMTKSIEQWWAEVDGVNRRDMQADFLDRFDVTFRIRRLQFVIRRLNQHVEFESIDAISAEALDEFKITAYGFLERLLDLRRARQIDDALIDQLFRAARKLPLDREETRELLASLSASLDLGLIDREVDAAFLVLCRDLQSIELRNAFVADYAGFPIYDVLLYTPGQSEQGPDPLTRIRVERISPRDAPSLAEVFDGLRSRTFMGFLGFFNRSYREHDYLWGRLHGAERIVDLLDHMAPGGIEGAAELRTELFKAIVRQEKQRLYRCDDVLARLDALLSRDRAKVS